MFNIAQGFKDIANKFKSGLPIKNGGTGATDRETAWSDLSVDANSFLQIYGISDTYQNITDSTYFLPISDDNQSDFNTVTNAGSAIRYVTDTVSWNGLSKISAGIGINFYDGKAGYYLVSGNIRYKNNNTGTKYFMQTAIVRKRYNIETDDYTYTNISWIVGNYTNERISQSFSQIVYLKPGDFVFLGGYKSSGLDASVNLGISTKWNLVKLI